MIRKPWEYDTKDLLSLLDLKKSFLLIYEATKKLLKTIQTYLINNEIIIRSVALFEVQSTNVLTSTIIAYGNRKRKLVREFN